MNKPQLYFKTDNEWYQWLSKNHKESTGVNLIFYKLETGKTTMRWEEAVKVALCFGWIDSTVRSLGNGKRQQVFTPRKSKSVWSGLNKSYIIQLKKQGRMQSAGLRAIKVAKENGSWTALDDVEKGIIPEDLQIEFNKNHGAYKNYKNFAPSYRKSYLYWLNQAKRQETRKKRIEGIIELCEKNIKSR